MARSRKRSRGKPEEKKERVLREEQGDLLAEALSEVISGGAEEEEAPEKAEGEKPPEEGKPEEPPTRQESEEGETDGDTEA